MAFSDVETDKQKNSSREAYFVNLYRYREGQRSRDKSLFIIAF